MKKINLGISGLILAALFTISSANAGSYSFNFIASDNSYDVSGIFTTSDKLNTLLGYDITGITGTVSNSGGIITGLVANPNQPNANTANGFNYNNVLYSGPQALDSNGVLFSSAGATTPWNLWGNSATGYELYNYGGGSVPQLDVTGTLNVAAVPEPETYAMFIAGLGLLGFIASRRKNDSMNMSMAA